MTYIGGPPDIPGINTATERFAMEGYSLLHHIVNRGDGRLVEWLLSLQNASQIQKIAHIGKKNVRNAGKKTASISSKLQVDVSVLSDGYQRTPLMCAAVSDRLDVMILLMRLGACGTVNHVDVYGRTAMHYAAVYAAERTVQV
jgi:hypothetical protein